VNFDLTVTFPIIWSLEYYLCYFSIPPISWHGEEFVFIWFVTFWYRKEEYFLNRSKMFNEVFLEHFNPTQNPIDESNNSSHHEYELSDTKNLFTYIKKRGNSTEMRIISNYICCKDLILSLNQCKTNFIGSCKLPEK
jgi:hypothetical protein